jgi:hypothetical protein
MAWQRLQCEKKKPGAKHYVRAGRNSCSGSQKLLRTSPTIAQTLPIRCALPKTSKAALFSDDFCACTTEQPLATPTCETEPPVP